MAREASGCEVWEQDFLKLDLPAGRFDGIFANASLFHVPRQELPRVLGELHASLKPAAACCSARIRAATTRGLEREPVRRPLPPRHLARLLTEAGFTELAHYYRPEGLPREQQPWLASVWRKPEAA